MLADKKNVQKILNELYQVNLHVFEDRGHCIKMDVVLHWTSLNEFSQPTCSYKNEKQIKLSYGSLFSLN
jgi:hypothetical protein